MTRTPDLTTEQAWSLEQLYQAREVQGHACTITRVGRATVLADGKPIGSPRPELWLRLVGLGMVEGHFGELRPTPAGRRFVEARLRKDQRNTPGICLCRQAIGHRVDARPEIGAPPADSGNCRTGDLANLSKQVTHAAG